MPATARRVHRLVASAAAAAVAAPLALTGSAAAYTGTKDDIKAGYLTGQETCDALRAASFEDCYTWPRGDRWIGPRQQAPDQIFGYHVAELGPYPPGTPRPITSPSAFVYQTIVSVDAYRTTQAATRAWAQVPAKQVSEWDARIVEQTDSVVVSVWEGGPGFRPSEFRVLAFMPAGDAVISGQCDTGTDDTWDGVTAEAALARGIQCAKIVATAQQAKWRTVSPTIAQPAQTAVRDPGKTLLTAAQVQKILGPRASQTLGPTTVTEQVTQWAPLVIFDAQGIWYTRWKISKTKTRGNYLTARIYQYGTVPDTVAGAAKRCGMAATATTSTSSDKVCARNGATLVMILVDRQPPQGPPASRLVRLASVQAARTNAAAVPVT